MKRFILMASILFGYGTMLYADASSLPKYSFPTLWTAPALPIPSQENKCTETISTTNNGNPEGKFKVTVSCSDTGVSYVATGSTLELARANAWNNRKSPSTTLTPQACKEGQTQIPQRDGSLKFRYTHCLKNGDAIIGEGSSPVEAANVAKIKFDKSKPMESVPLKTEQATPTAAVVPTNLASPVVSIPREVSIDDIGPERVDTGNIAPTPLTDTIPSTPLSETKKSTTPQYSNCQNKIFNEIKTLENKRLALKDQNVKSADNPNLKELQNQFDQEMGEYVILQGIKDLKRDYDKSLVTFSKEKKELDKDLKNLEALEMASAQYQSLNKLLSSHGFTQSSDPVKFYTQNIKQDLCKNDKNTASSFNLCSGVSKRIYESDKIKDMIVGFHNAMLAIEQNPDEVKTKKLLLKFKERLTSANITENESAFQKSIADSQLISTRDAYKTCLNNLLTTKGNDAACAGEKAALAESLTKSKEFLGHTVSNTASLASAQEIVELAATLKFASKQRQEGAFQALENACNFQKQRNKSDGFKCNSTPKEFCNKLQLLSKDCKCDENEPTSVDACLGSIADKDKLATDLRALKEKLDKTKKRIDAIKDSNPHEALEDLKGALLGKMDAECGGTKSPYENSELASCSIYIGVPGLKDLHAMKFLGDIEIIDSKVQAGYAQEKYSKRAVKIAALCDQAFSNSTPDSIPESCKNASQTREILNDNTVTHFDSRGNILGKSRKKSWGSLVGTAALTHGLQMAPLGINYYMATNYQYPMMRDQAIAQKQYLYDQQKYNAMMWGYQQDYMFNNMQLYNSLYPSNYNSLGGSTFNGTNPFLYMNLPIVTYTGQ